MYFFDDQELALQLREDAVSEASLWKYFLVSIIFTSIVTFLLWTLLYICEVNKTLRDLTDGSDAIGSSDAMIYLNKAVIEFIIIIINIYSLRLIYKKGLGFIKSLQYYTCLLLPISMRTYLLCCFISPPFLAVCIIYEESLALYGISRIGALTFILYIPSVLYFYKRMLHCFDVISANGLNNTKSHK
ncbi:MAG: hypothetical protein ACRY3E_03665 [Candidatus Lariskella arthropodorum]|uniref:hypothetical protein n=1 Tax=Candidatus Lariskella endosymbiont of Epinotia ramella TaxID=3066224 RepID=UPI0030D257C0